MVSPAQKSCSRVLYTALSLTSSPKVLIGPPLTESAFVALHLLINKGLPFGTPALLHLLLLAGHPGFPRRVVLFLPYTEKQRRFHPAFHPFNVVETSPFFLHVLEFNRCNSSPNVFCGLFQSSRCERTITDNYPPPSLPPYASSNRLRIPPPPRFFFIRIPTRY